MYSESRPKRKRLPQLPDDPTAPRMRRDVEMQDTPAIVADDKETVEDAERDLWHGEEVHRRNRFPVMLKKRAPTFGRPGIPRPQAAAFPCCRFSSLPGPQAPQHLCRNYVRTCLYCLAG